jgi:Protein of unknown function (DUF1570)
MSRRLFLLLPLLTAALATAREPPAKWIEVSTPRFTIVTNSSEKQGRQIAGRFERMRAVFQQAYPEFEDEPDSPVFVLAVKNKDQFRALEPSTYLSKKALRLHGLFVRAPEKNYILMRLDSEAGNPYPLVYHEYSHLFLGQEDQRLPLWLNEGLAEFYQQTEIYGRDVLLGEENQQHLMLLREEKLLPLTGLFTVDEKSPYYLEEKKGAIFYAECWALTHYLLLKDYAEKTSAVQQYTKLVNENVDPISAATRTFGDLQKLQRSLQTYVEQHTFNHFETKLPSRVDESNFQVQSITAARAQAVEADYLVASGRPEQAKALFPSLAPDDVQAPGFASLDLTQAKTGSLGEIQEDTACPLSQVLHGTSERAVEMVDNLQRFTATEQIEHTEFRNNGKPRRSANQLFSYVAEIDQGPAGAFWIEEYRAAKSEGDPPPLSDTGTAAFALIFHPQKITNFEFHCEGQVDVQGTSAWQVRFEESPDPSKSFHQMRINHSTYQLRFKGRAWIAADSYQILRLQTDLVAPVLQIQLQVEHLDITYAPVDFQKPKFRVWLPESASMQISYHHRRYQRLHKFSHFQLFLVLTEQTVKEPNSGPGA